MFPPEIKLFAPLVEYHRQHMARHSTRKKKKHEEFTPDEVTIDAQEFEGDDEEDDEPKSLAVAERRDLSRHLPESEVIEVILTLTPPDLRLCQCEWEDDVVTLGPRPRVRCDQEPAYVAFQKREADSDGPTGAMSVCENHKTLLEHMWPHQCFFRRITPEGKIGVVV